MNGLKRVGLTASSTSENQTYPTLLKLGSLVLAGTLLTGELAHIALPPHTALSYEDGNIISTESCNERYDLLWVDLVSRF
jgi:hypothetical protein